MRAALVPVRRWLAERFRSALSPACVATALFLVSFALRLTFINRGFFHHDAILLFNAVRQSVAQGALVPFLDGRYALVAFYLPCYLVSVVCAFPSDLSFNVFTALISSLSVVVLYLLARELIKERFASLAAASLFSFMPLYFAVSTHTMPHPLSVCLALLSFYLLLLGKRRGGWSLHLLASFSLLLAISARFPNILLIPSFFLVYFEPRFGFFGVRIDRAKFSVGLIPAAAPLAVGLLLIYSFQSAGIRSNAEASAFLGLFSPKFKLALSNLYVNVGALGVLLLLAGAALSFRKMVRAHALALLLWFLLLFFFYGNVQTYADRFLSIIFPLVAVYMALALAGLARFSSLLSAALLLWFLASMFLTVYPMAKDRHLYSGEKEYALWLKGRTEPNALILTMDDSVFVEHYGERRTKGHPQGSIEETADWAAEIGTYLRAGVPVYLMESGLSYDPGEIVAQTVQNRFALIYVGAHRTEDYHDNGKSFLQRDVYDESLFRLAERSR